MITTLRIVFVLVFLWMTYTVVSTSLESNLIEEWSTLGAIPWMRATLWDFYAILLPLLLWMWYRESSAVARILWSLGFVGLGSIATSAYLLMRLFSVDARAGLREVILRPEEGA